MKDKNKDTVEHCKTFKPHCLATPNQKPQVSSLPLTACRLRFRRCPPGDADAPDEGAAGEEPRGGVPQEPGDRLSEERPAQIRGQRSR